MSASFFYSQVCPVPEQQLSCWAPSAFRTAMEKCFGDLPWIVRPEDIPRLEGMAAICCDGGGNPYQELIDAIGTHGTVHIRVEY